MFLRCCTFLVLPRWISVLQGSHPPGCINLSSNPLGAMTSALDSRKTSSPRNGPWDRELQGSKKPTICKPNIHQHSLQNSQHLWKHKTYLRKKTPQASNIHINIPSPAKTAFLGGSSEGKQQQRKQTTRCLRLSDTIFQSSQSKSACFTWTGEVPRDGHAWPTTWWLGSSACPTKTSCAGRSRVLGWTIPPYGKWLGGPL